MKKGDVRGDMIEMAELFSQSGVSEIKQRLLSYVLETIFTYFSNEF